MAFIVTEGLDASGKSTQVANLLEYFNKNKIKHQYLHFPRTDTGLFGNLISKFLRGEMGQLEKVDPYLVATIYAGDRFDAKHQINDWLDKKYLVLIDRYVFSNIAFQCAKISNTADKESLSKWIFDLEFGLFALPVPDISIFLDAPFSFTQKQLTTQRNGKDRNYLAGKSDIHEADLNFQQKVKNEYLKMIVSNKNFVRIDCSDENGNMLHQDKIFEKIISVLKTKKIL